MDAAAEEGWRCGNAELPAAVGHHEEHFAEVQCGLHSCLPRCHTLCAALHVYSVAVLKLQAGKEHSTSQTIVMSTLHAWPQTCSLRRAMTLALRSGALHFMGSMH